jgi:hypothetical protein
MSNTIRWWQNKNIKNNRLSNKIRDKSCYFLNPFFYSHEDKKYRIIDNRNIRHRNKQQCHINVKKYNKCEAIQLEFEKHQKTQGWQTY